MKNLTIYFSFFLSSIISVWACGPYYPYGDDARYSLVQANEFSPTDYQRFNYCSSIWYDAHDLSYLESQKGTMANLQLWAKHCDRSVSLEDIKEAVYFEGKVDIAHFPDNSFVKYLHKMNRTDISDYLNYAKKCQDYNTTDVSDPWERGGDLTDIRNLLIQEGERMAAQIGDLDVKRRYAFIALRLAFYNGYTKKVKQIYEKYYTLEKRGDIMDSWAAYFYAMSEPNGAKKNYLLAQPFQDAPGKRKRLSEVYDRTIPIEEVLSFAKTEEQKANVYLIHGIRDLGQSGLYIKELYKLQPNSEGLNILLLREISKLEDWLHTPLYTNFNPAISGYSIENNGHKLLDDRILDDKSYLTWLLKFVRQVRLEEVNNPVIWNLTETYLNFLDNNYAATLEKISSIRSASENINIVVENQLDMLESLSLVSIASNRKGEISQTIKQMILEEEEKGNWSFLFALARRAEFKGNTTDAAIILSKLNNYSKNNTKSISWRTNAGHQTLWSDVYDDYYFYLDAQYSPVQMEELIHSIQKVSSKDKSEVKYFEPIKMDELKLKELLATKYLRRNQLDKALAIYETIGNDFWFSEESKFKRHLNKNPFHISFINENYSVFIDSTQFTKTSITRQLIDFIENGNDKKNKDKDLYNFLAANCYFNMSQYGNSWMMRRYYWTSYIQPSKLIDDDEYYKLKTAKAYYLKAASMAKSEKFEALCYRLAGRCEDYQLQIEHKGQSWEDRRKKNAQYDMLEKKHGEYYEELISSCLFFDRFVNSRQ